MDKEKKKLTYLGHRHDRPSNGPFNHRDRCLLTHHRYLEFQLKAGFFFFRKIVIKINKKVYKIHRIVHIIFAFFIYVFDKNRYNGAKLRFI